MGGRRRKIRDQRNEAGGGTAFSKVFAEFQLRPEDFKVDWGRGKSFLSGQRIVWMTLTELSTGRQLKGKIGTTKKAAEAHSAELLRSLLRSRGG